MVTDQSANLEAQTPALLLDNVVKTYGPIRAVDGVSFVARAGEFIGCWGPMGREADAFQPLPGLFTADSGRIEVMGHDMSRDPSRRWPGSGSCSSSPPRPRTVGDRWSPFHAGCTACRARPRSRTRRAQLSPRSAPRQDRAAERRHRRRVGRARHAAPAAPVTMDEPRRLDPASAPTFSLIWSCGGAAGRHPVGYHLCDEVPDADRVIVLHRGVRADTTPPVLITSSAPHHRGGVPP